MSEDDAAHGWAKPPDDFHEPTAEASERLREQRLSAGPGDGTLPRTEAHKDEIVRRSAVATPSATMIGRPEEPDDDVSERMRRLHEEQHPAMEGHAERMHRLDKIRITHAICNSLGLVPWERDRVLGILRDLDLREFGSQRAIEKVGLIVIRHVVDDERKQRLGLDEMADTESLTPRRMAELYNQFTSITDEDRYREMLDDQDLDGTAVNRLTRTLREQIEDTPLEDAALGRAPNRDPSLPAMLD